MYDMWWQWHFCLSLSFDGPYAWQPIVVFRLTWIHRKWLMREREREQCVASCMPEQQFKFKAKNISFNLLFWSAPLNKMQRSYCFCLCRPALSLPSKQLCEYHSLHEWPPYKLPLASSSLYFILGAFENKVPSESWTNFTKKSLDYTVKWFILTTRIGWEQAKNLCTCCLLTWLS